ncbi:MAG TPA: NAD(P)H-dependent oxidoreductase subunit E [Actinomycetota bacterium]|nr:NAD(P)H-dependent oxidoreductase subunit E [Actinomycetota bacterium]
MPLSDQSLARAEELIARYPQRRSALLPILFLLQAEDGYVSPAGVAQVADLLGLTKAEVGAVATFYTMFRRRPVGKYLVSVCKTLSCQLRGAREISAALTERLEVPLGGTDQSGMVTVEEVECLAACDGAPVVQVNTENYERLTTEEALALVEALLRDEVPPPTFAADGSVTEPSTAALHWRLAGLGDPTAAFGRTAAAAEAEAGPAAAAVAANGQPAARRIGREPSPPEPTEQREAGEPQPAEGAGAAAPEAPTEPEPEAPGEAHGAPQDEGPAPEREEAEGSGEPQGGAPVDQAEEGR